MPPSPPMSVPFTNKCIRMLSAMAGNSDGYGVIFIRPDFGVGAGRRVLCAGDQQQPRGNQQITQCNQRRLADANGFAMHESKE